jgi:tight adherence protein B
MFLALGVFFAFLALCILVFTFLGSRNSEIALSRRRPGGAIQTSALSKVTTSAVSFVDNAVGKTRSSGTRVTLEKAGLRMKPADYILMVTCAAFVAGIVGFIMSGLLFGLLLMIVTPFAAKLFVSVLTARRRAKFELQLGDTLQMLAGGMRAGHSLLRSIDAVAQEAESPTREEFARIVAETRLGRDLKDSMGDAANRLDSEDFVWTAQAIEIHREVGGDLADVLDHVGETIRERAQVKGQVRALSAEGRLSAYILIALPVGMFFYLSLTNAPYIGLLYSNLLGWIMVVSAVILLGLGAFWLSRVVKIKF